MFKILASLFGPKKATVNTVPLLAPTYVGREDDLRLLSNQAVHAFLQSTLLPDGGTWFFLQPGKNTVKLQTKADGELVRATFESNLKGRKVTLNTYTHGISKDQYIHFEWKSGDVLNDWAIEVHTHIGAR